MNKFVFNNNVIKKVMSSIFFTFFGVILSTAVISYISKGNNGSSHGLLYFSFFNNMTGIQILINSFFLIVSVNALFSGIISLISYSKAKDTHETTLVKYLSGGIWGGIFWGILNFVLWGTFSLVILSFGNHTNEVDLNVFYTSGLIAGLVHSPLATFGFYYIGEILLHDSTEEDLYNLNVKAILRFYVPNLLVGISTGILFGYFANSISSDSLTYKLYENRYSVLIILLIWFVFLYFVFNVLDNNTFTIRIFKWKNIPAVWIVFFILWFSFVLIGIEILIKFKDTDLFYKQKVHDTVNIKSMKVSSNIKEFCPLNFSHKFADNCFLNPCLSNT